MKKMHYLPLILSVVLLCGCSKTNYPSVIPVPSQDMTQNTEPGTTPEDPGVSSESSTPEGATEDTEVTLPSTESEPEPEITGTYIIASDIHYLADSLTDRGTMFQQMVEHGDGKVVQYTDQIVDAFLDDVIGSKLDVLILSGDVSLNGELQSHIDFARKLKRVEDSGIPVLVIPGNHDINNRAAAQFKGNDRLPAGYTSPEEFLNIYQDYGYGEAFARDPESLSYVYQLDENTRFLMLDSCQYDPVNRIGGMIKTETYEWIELQLEDAWEQGITVIPVSHHNLLDESEVYVDDCTIEHSESLVSLLEGWDVPIHLSGHLHVQHSKRSGEDEGIYEIVTSSLVTPPCQYGILERLEDDTYRYRTQAVDVEGWAARNHVENDELLHFEEFKAPFLSRVFYNQAQDKMKDKKIPEETKDLMSKLYSKLNTYYYAGEAVRVKRKVMASPLYKCWEDYMYDDILLQYMQSIINDANRDYNTAVIE